MIQATELRIGNKVIFGVGPVPATVFTIEYTRKDGYLINGQVPQDHVHPIPLSPDILEKCGFVKDTIENPFFSGYSIKLPRKRELSISSPGTPNEMVFINEIEDDGKRAVVVLRNFDYDGKTYLHHLQNIFYFNSPGEELTLNL